MNLEEQVFADLVKSFEERGLAVRPKKLFVPSWMHTTAMRLLYYKPPMRRVSGIRQRKLALYWREK